MCTTPKGDRIVGDSKNWRGCGAGAGRWPTSSSWRRFSALLCSAGPLLATLAAYRDITAIRPTTANRCPQGITKTEVVVVPAGNTTIRARRGNISRRLASHPAIVAPRGSTPLLLQAPARVAPRGNIRIRLASHPAKRAPRGSTRALVLLVLQLKASATGVASRGSPPVLLVLLLKAPARFVTEGHISRRLARHSACRAARGSTPLLLVLALQLKASATGVASRGRPPMFLVLLI